MKCTTPTRSNRGPSQFYGPRSHRLEEMHQTMRSGPDQRPRSAPLQNVCTSQEYSSLPHCSYSAPYSHSLNPSPPSFSYSYARQHALSVDVESVWGRLRVLQTIPDDLQLRTVMNVQRKLIMWLCDRYDIPYALSEADTFSDIEDAGFEEMLRALCYCAGVRLLEDPKRFHFKS